MASKEAISYGLKLLGIRDYFKAELFIKVAAKYGEAAAKEAVSALEEWRYLNDERVADNFIRMKLLSGYGPYYISGKLYEKGYSLSSQDIMNKAEACGIDIEEQIEKLAERHSIKESGDLYRDRAKRMRFLMNRGYPSWLCDKILKKRGL